MRNLLLLLAILTSAATLQARTITESAALQKASTFVSKPAFAKGYGQNHASQIRLAYKSTIGAEQAGYYVFNLGNGNGFVIVAGDDNANEILGYSDRGSFDYSTLPDNVKDWLSGYDAEIKYLSQHGNQATAKSETENLGKTVAPLLGDIAWNQDSPYNDMCPKYYGSTRSATGCVATAIAQIMYYWQYPATGQGSHSYTPLRYGDLMGEQAVDFSQSNYQWDKMLPVYTSESSEESKQAVAKLMYDCGVSVDMDYGEQSGTMSPQLCAPLVNNFLYDKGLALRTRIYYGIEEWDGIIRDELDNGRPVFATGYTSTGGHAFVFDGYDNQGFIHVNWGWGRMSNGYFRSTALTPASQGIGGSNGGFNSKQLIITGIMPAKVGSEADLELISTEGLKTSANNFAKTQPVTVELRGKLGNVGWQDAVCDLGIGIYDSNGTLLKVIEGEKSVKIAKDEKIYGAQYGEVSFASLTNDGAYRIFPICKVAGGKNWVKVRNENIAEQNYLDLLVSGDNIRVQQPEFFELKASDVTASEIYQNINTRISATITNNGDNEYYGNVKAALFSKSNRRSVAETSGYIIDLLPGESTELVITGAFNATPGDYYLALIDDDKTKLNDFIDVTVNAQPADQAKLVAASQLSFADNDNVQQNDMKISANIKCEQGIFAGTVYIYIYDKEGAVVMGCLNPEYVSLKSGETATVNFSGPFENGVPGTVYKACLVDGNTMTYITPANTASCMFTLRNDLGSVDGVGSDEIISKEVYTVSGIRISDRENLEPGIYIIKESGKNGVKTYKVVKN